MAIVDTSSDALPARGADNSWGLVDPIRSRALLRAAIGTVANLSTDSSGSLYRLARIPSRAILRPESQLDLNNWGYAAATLGLAAERGGLLTANGLATTITIASLSGALTTPIAKFGAKWGKPVWEQAGLSADPGGLVDVVIATAANAAGAGVATFDLVWQID